MINTIIATTFTLLNTAVTLVVISIHNNKTDICMCVIGATGRRTSEFSFLLSFSVFGLQWLQNLIVKKMVQL